MEIKKALYVLLVGVILCLVFVGIFKGVESVDKGEEGVKSPTATPYVQVSSVPEEEPTNEPVIRVTQEPMQTTMSPIESIEETMKPIEEPTEQPTEQPKEAMGESDKQISPQPVTTASPTVPTSEPTPKREEIPLTQNTPLPVPPTKAPEEPQTPLPQSTNTPMPTEEPSEEESHVHEFEKAVWELPTCQKGGYYNNICKACGFEESVTQEPLPHQVEDVMIQEGNCMEDRVIRHICKECEMQVGSDTRYSLYDVHQWRMEEVDGTLVEYCERCGVVK